jgi:ribokinase
MSRNNTITVVGSVNMDFTLLVDELPNRGSTVTASRLHVTPGGKGANQAVAAAKLGSSVRIIARVGRDQNGLAAEESLKSAGVAVDHLEIDEDMSTGLAFVTVDSSGSNTIVVYQGANGSLMPADVVRHSCAIGDAGALMAQLEVPLETVDCAFDVARSSGVFTVLNPAPAVALPDSILRNTDLIIPNETEATILTGVEVDNVRTAQEAARKLRLMGPERVVITLGSNGAMYLGPEGALYHDAFKVDTVDSTAAGDSFVGAFVTRWLGGDKPDQCLEFACAAGALTTTRIGAQESLPNCDEVKELIIAARRR